MDRPICYKYHSDFLPMIEAVLAANGYSVEIPMQKMQSGAMAMVMRSGAATIVLSHTPPHVLAEVEVWGEAKSEAIELLESLPFSRFK